VLRVTSGGEVTSSAWVNRGTAPHGASVGGHLTSFSHSRGANGDRTPRDGQTACLPGTRRLCLGAVAYTECPWTLVRKHQHFQGVSLLMEVTV